MGAWLEVAEVEYYINKKMIIRGRQKRRIENCDLFVHVYEGDFADMNDVKEASLWECEIPLSDDGF